MDEIVITSLERLKEWFVEYGYFEEGYCLCTRPTAEDYPHEHAEFLGLPESVEVEIAQQVGGGSMAGDVRVIQVFALTAFDVRDWMPGCDADPYMDGGVEVAETNGAIALDLFPHGRVVCGRLVIRQLPDRSVPVRPYADPCAVSVRVDVGAPPAPADWLDWFRLAGEDVAWRVYGGDNEWPVEQMSLNDYAGFLQRRRDLGVTPGGVWVEVFTKDEGAGFRLHLSGGGRDASVLAHDRLWLIAREALLQFDTARFRTGNCMLTAEQWGRYVREGFLPNF